MILLPMARERIFMKNYTSILFDLDGTLSRSAEGITKSLQYGLTAIGIEEPDLSKLTRFIGPPLNVELAAFYHLSSEDIGKVIGKFRERYETIGIYECEPYPGIAALIRDLHAKGYSLAVSSSKPEPHVKEMIRRFGIADNFDFLCGSSIEDELANKSGTDNKEKIIRRTLKLLQEKDADRKFPRTVMVGDTKYDIIGAKKNSVDAIGVTYGYGTREELVEAGADFLADSVDELRALLLGKR